MALDLTGQAIDNILLSKVDAPIGTYRDSDLDVATFNSQNLGTWMLCNGQSSIGTEYEILTGKMNVPDFLTEGTFRRQAKTGRTLGSYEADALQQHTHSSPYGYYNGASGPRGASGNDAAGAPQQTSGVNNANSADETRPKNIACNVFIKVSHT